MYFLCPIHLSSIHLRFIKNKAGINSLFVFFGILPALNFFGYWDFFIYHRVYSVIKPPDHVCMHSQTGKRHKDITALFYYSIKTNSYAIVILFYNICNAHGHSRKCMVPPYPEIRVYKKIKSQLLQRYPDMDATFIVLKYINGRREKIELK